MSNDSGQLFAIVDGTIDKLTSEDFGKLDLVVQRRAEQDFSLFDTFDEALLSSDRLLLEVGGEFHLILANGEILIQASVRKGNFTADFAPGPVRDALADVSALRCYVELANGKLTSASCSLTDDEGKTRVRLNLMELHGETGTIILAETTPLRGYRKAHADLCKRLGEGQAEAGHTAARLRAALLPDHAPYIAKPRIALGPDQPAIEAATSIISAYLAVARRNEEGVIAHLDTEFLHDYRVALRKVRSVLSLFKGVYSDGQTMALKKSFSALMDPTGRLRDLDVYLLERDTYYAMLPETLHNGLGQMFRRFETARRNELRKLTRRFHDPSYQREIRSLQSLFSISTQLHTGPQAKRPALDYACELIWKRYRKVCKHGRAIDNSTPDEKVHELRIDCKKLRYLMEFFGPLFPKGEVKELISHLKGLQENLGFFNDYSVQQVALQDFLDRMRNKGSSQSIEIAKSVGALIAVLHQRQIDERARVTQSFAEFDSPDMQESFRRLFHNTEPAT